MTSDEINDYLTHGGEVMFDYERFAELLRNGTIRGVKMKNAQYIPREKIKKVVSPSGKEYSTREEEVHAE